MIDDDQDNPDGIDSARLALDTAIDDIVFACTNLCELLEIENEALRRHDAATIGELTASKKALGELYERAMAPLLDDPELFQSVEPETRDSLAALGGRLRELMELNALMLRAEMDATQQVMDIVVEAAKKEATHAGPYGRTGNREAPAGSRGSSMAYNKTL